MFINDQSGLQYSPDYFGFVWKELDRNGAYLWPWQTHFDLIKSISGH